MRTNSLRKIAAGCALAAIAGWAWGAAPLYGVSCLDCSLGFPVMPMDINAGGVVVAIDDIRGEYPALCYGGQGYVFDHGIVTPTPSFDEGDLGSSACAISDLNVVVGAAGHTQYPWGPFGYAWDGTTMVDLGDGINDYGDGYFSRATSVNSRGHVVGHASGGYHDVELFIYKNGRMRKIPPPAGTHDSNFNLPVRINAKDHIAGTSLGNLDDLSHAWIYKAGVATALAPDAYSSEAYGINDKDEVVGTVRLSYDDYLVPVLWSGGSTTLLNMLPGLDRWGEANDINKAGWIVGDTCGDTACTAFVYNGHRVFDLNSRMDGSGAGWTLSHASSINDSGIIVGTGTFNGAFHAFMATPVAAMGAE